MALSSSIPPGGFESDDEALDAFLGWVEGTGLSLYAAQEEAILELKHERNAVLRAHYYQESEVQDVADFVGDSLALAQAASGLPEDAARRCGRRDRPRAGATAARSDRGPRRWRSERTGGGGGREEDAAEETPADRAGGAAAEAKE